MQTEVGLFIFHVSLPGSCLLQVSVSPSFFYFYFLFGGYMFGSLVKRVMHQPPHALSVECAYYFFYSDALLTLITSIYGGEKYVPD